MPCSFSLHCRLRKEGDTVNGKLKQACKQVMHAISNNESDTGNVDSKFKKEDNCVEKFEYDVFVSYSHKNPSEAETMLKIFADLDPKVKVFYDRSELVMGELFRLCIWSLSLLFSAISSWLLRNIWYLLSQHKAHLFIWTVAIVLLTIVYEYWPETTE